MVNSPSCDSTPIPRRSAAQVNVRWLTSNPLRPASASAGVLVGTQMVAKGHDFPDVTLGVVIDADATLRFPDFRSEERTFQLVAQLAGRAGRGPRGGRVLVQTIAPETRVLELAAAHDADGFLELELSRRDALGYPPAAALVRIVCTAADEEAADLVSDALVEAVEQDGLELLGPAPLFRPPLRLSNRMDWSCSDQRRYSDLEAGPGGRSLLGPLIVRRSL